MLRVAVALLALAGLAGTFASAAFTREPDLTLPGDLTVEAAGAAGSIVTFSASARGRDNQQLPVTCSPSSGARFPLAQTTVTCTAQEREGEIATGSFNVTVADRTAPAVVVPSGLSVRTKAKKGAIVGFTTSATDLVDGAISPTCSPAAGTRFAVGSTRVACTATDRHGNVGRGSFDVTVTFAGRLRRAALFAPPAGATVSAPPLLGWRRVARASYYNVQVYRNGIKILSVWPSRTHFQLRRAWAYRGRTYRLDGGRYVWLVWPGFGDVSGARYGRLLGRSTFRINTPL